MDPAGLAALRAEHGRVLERALEAEAGRAEAAFRLDEVMGHLLIARESSVAGAPAPVPTRATPVPAPVAPSQDEAAAIQARLTGTVRGLTAALSESEEARDMANARRLLVEHDLEEARERVTALSRQLAEARDQAELGDVQSRALAARLAGSLDVRAAGAVRGEALGARFRLDEAERALAVLAQDLDAGQADAADLRQSLGEARAELSALRAESAAMQERISELDRAVAREAENAREAAALATRQHAERLVLHDELARARSELLDLRASLDELRSGQTRAREQADAERSSARQAAADRHARAERMTDALREVRTLLGELPAALMRALSPDPLASRDPTLPGTVRAFEGATMAGAAGQDSVDDALRTLEARVTEATRVLRTLQDAPDAADVRERITALLRLLES
jgi:septal ring factor EnvC (AmiA/AmiB activator)